MPNATNPRQRRPLLQGTIWDRSLLEEVPQRWRSLYTIVLPLKYALFVGFGIAGTLSRISSVVEFFSVSYGDAWTILVAAAAALALAGVVLRRPRLELYSVIALVALLLSYLGSLLALADAGDGDLLALSALLPVVFILPAWRIVDIVRTERRRG